MKNLVNALSHFHKYTLSKRAPIELEILDISGRLVKVKGIVFKKERE